MGTPSYMAPEQAQGKKDVGPAADVYALGAILYECLTGRPPFKAANLPETLLQVVCNDPVPPRQLNRQLPLDLETICLKCLSKLPAQRYASARALAEDLERFHQGKPVKARPLSGPARAWRWARRKPFLAAALLVVAIGLVGGSSALLWKLQARHATEAPAPPPRLAWRLVEPLPATFTGQLAEELRPLRDHVLGLEAPVDAETLGKIGAARKKAEYDPPDVHYFSYLLDPALRLENPLQLRWAKTLHLHVAVYLVPLVDGKGDGMEHLSSSPQTPGEIDVPARAGLYRIVAFVFPLDEDTYTHLREHGFSAKLVPGE
jgi:hypothetical protein